MPRYVHLLWLLQPPLEDIVLLCGEHSMLTPFVIQFVDISRHITMAEPLPNDKELMVQWAKVSPNKFPAGYAGFLANRVRSVLGLLRDFIHLALTFGRSSVYFFYLRLFEVDI